MFLAFWVLSPVIHFVKASDLRMIPGVSCGIITPIRRVEKLADSDTCVIVLDEKEYDEYKIKIKEKPGRYTFKSVMHQILVQYSIPSQ